MAIGARRIGWQSWSVVCRRSCWQPLGEARRPASGSAASPHPLSSQLGWSLWEQHQPAPPSPETACVWMCCVRSFVRSSATSGKCDVIFVTSSSQPITVGLCRIKTYAWQPCWCCYTSVVKDLMSCRRDLWRLSVRRRRPVTIVTVQVKLLTVHAF